MREREAFEQPGVPVPVRTPRPYRVRKPKDYLPRAPADLVEVDTLDVCPLPGVVFKHFTGRDVIPRCDVLEVHRKATATTAAGFLDTLQARMPFPIRSAQVDGGSEFHAAFEAECQLRALRLFVLPPRSPKLNGAVERAQRTHIEERRSQGSPPATSGASLALSRCALRAIRPLTPKVPPMY